MEHPEDFVSPQTHKLRCSAEVGRLGQEKPLSHSGQVSQVEDVMEAGGGGRQLLNDVGVELQGQACQLPGSSCSGSRSHPEQQLQLLFLVTNLGTTGDTGWLQQAELWIQKSANMRSM